MPTCKPCVIVAMLLSGSAGATRPGGIVAYGFLDRGPFKELRIVTRWEVAPEEGNIYAAFVYSFEAGPVAYMGTQLVGRTRKAIFSMWDVSAGEQSAHELGACGRFDNEDTGVRCLIDYPWQVGRGYLLRVWLVPANSSKRQWCTWAGSITDTVTGRETLIGKIEVRDSKGFRGYGRLKNDAIYTFLEYFAGPDECDGQPRSSVTWTGPYARASLVPAVSARANHPYPNCSKDPCPSCMTNHICSPQLGVVHFEAGGMTARFTKVDTELWAPGSPGLCR